VRPRKSRIGLYLSNYIFSYSRVQFPDAYTRTKAEAERLVMKANDKDELLTCCIRPGTIFGPGDTVVPALVSCGGTMVSTLSIILQNLT
jgi:nucleoside-diphosphate-sugar epimerase